MKSGLILVAMISLFATHSFARLEVSVQPKAEGYGAESAGDMTESKPWPCCDRCGECKAMEPSSCQCDDWASLCPPGCRNCVKIATPSLAGLWLFRCNDFVPNICAHKCHHF